MLYFSIIVLVVQLYGAGSRQTTRRRLERDLNRSRVPIYARPVQKHQLVPGQRASWSASLPEIRCSSLAMSHRGRMKRAGRLNWALSLLLAVLVAWYMAASVGSRATISAFTALAASLCGFTGGWVGWRTRKAHKRQTPLRQVRFQRCCNTRFAN